jgi:hypothetical protein
MDDPDSAPPDIADATVLPPAPAAPSQQHAPKPNNQPYTSRQPVNRHLNMWDALTSVDNAGSWLTPFKFNRVVTAGSSSTLNTAMEPDASLTVMMDKMQDSSRLELAPASGNAHITSVSMTLGRPSYFKPMCELGKGSFGSVSLAEDARYTPHVKVAIKTTESIMRHPGDQSLPVDSSDYAELHNLRMLSMEPHENVIRMHSWFLEDSSCPTLHDRDRKATMSTKAIPV